MGGTTEVEMPLLPLEPDARLAYPHPWLGVQVIGARSTFMTASPGGLSRAYSQSVASSCTDNTAFTCKARPQRPAADEMRRPLLARFVWCNALFDATPLSNDTLMTSIYPLSGRGAGNQGRRPRSLMGKRFEGPRSW
jgi:hypothetical protein